MEMLKKQKRVAEKEVLQSVKRVRQELLGEEYFEESSESESESDSESMKSEEKEKEEKKSEVKEEKKEKGKVKGKGEALHVGISGIRHGEVIVGIGSGAACHNVGAKFQVLFDGGEGCYYSPKKKYVNKEGLEEVMLKAGWKKEKVEWVKCNAKENKETHAGEPWGLSLRNEGRLPVQARTHAKSRTQQPG